ncbi:glycosyl hydrolase [Paractinoplanes atraurantiacus]|uniref:Alpha-L-rhamnosidase n=1 Tax=Paractinoplanes atraurantiacus TaxID=1036182 RepID=A0A285K8I7_9ACTN|nr:glycosyl hydrolase [Actinoplanes atraurantiacus]SNY68900.1 alpha-L-rhamnosidase [Actinoplanes atraurantiacus]
MKRRTVIALGAAAALATNAPASAAAAATPAKAAGTGAKFRWWWPHGLVDPAEIAREIDQMADAGFAGAEIQDVHHSVRADLDAAGHGWGTRPWRDAVESALRQAKRRGLTIDLAVGPSWPAAVPGITPDDPAAAKELVHTVTPFTSSITAPVADDVFAVQIARIVSGTTLDPASVRTLTPAGGQVTATVDGGSWLLFTYTVRGSGQEPEGGPHTVPPSYVVDHFSAAGTRAVIDAWNELVLTGPIRQLLRQAGGDLFEDSLELETDWTLWTPAMPAEFARRTGTDLLPYLPILLNPKGKYLYSFDSDTSNHVRDAFNQVLSDLYHEHHLIPLRDFAHRLGLQLRAQPYGLSTDAIRSATLLDVAEGESLGFKNLDDYRVLASARDMAGKRILSCESAAYANGAYSTTWNKVLQTMGSVFAGGVNQAVLHGFAYKDAPGAAWPGFAAFSPYNGNGIGYAEAWGPRQPTWRHARDVAGWFARTQELLQSGTARADLVFFRQKGWTATGIGAPWATNDGIPIGWTHGFTDEASLALPAAKVRDGRLGPPRYKALILDGDAFRGKDHTLSVRAAHQLLALAKAGLPIVVIGNWADVHPAPLQLLVAELLASPSTRVVADQTGVPAALEAAGVTRDVEYERSSLMTVHRVDGDKDYYYLANARHAENRTITAIDQDVWLTTASRSSVPVRIDAWTGEKHGVAHTRDGNRVRVRATLQPGQSMLLAFQRGRADIPARTFSEPAVAVTGWELSVEDWQPTGVTTHQVTLTDPLPWSSIPELADVSGIGTYRTTVTADRAGRALLSLGKVVDTCRVRVNGRLLPPIDVLEPVADLALRKGRNTIEVEVATTLLNRLRTTSPAVFGIATRQAYGLLGPVSLRPYR